MKGNFNSQKSVIPLSGIHGNMVGQRHEKLPKLPMRYITSCKPALAIVTLSGIYAPLTAILHCFGAISQNIVGDNADLCPNVTSVCSVAFTFAAATADNFIKSKPRTL